MAAPVLDEDVVLAGEPCLDAMAVATAQVRNVLALGSGRRNFGAQYVAIASPGAEDRLDIRHGLALPVSAIPAFVMSTDAARQAAPAGVMNPGRVL